MRPQLDTVLVLSPRPSGVRGFEPGNTDCLLTKNRSAGLRHGESAVPTNQPCRGRRSAAWFRGLKCEMPLGRILTPASPPKDEREKTRTVSRYAPIMAAVQKSIDRQPLEELLLLYSTMRHRQRRVPLTKSSGLVIEKSWRTQIQFIEEEYATDYSQEPIFSALS